MVTREEYLRSTNEQIAGLEAKKAQAQSLIKRCEEAAAVIRGYQARFAPMLSTAKEK